MKRSILTAACLAFALGLGMSAAMPSAAFAADKKMHNKCEKIKNEKKRAACVEKETKKCEKIKNEKKKAQCLAKLGGAPAK